jgi:hypothetical protein
MGISDNRNCIAPLDNNYFNRLRLGGQYICYCSHAHPITVYYCPLNPDPLCADEDFSEAIIYLIY